MFRKLLVRALLEKAILFEEQAYRFYESALERTAIGENAELLRKLLAEELRHRIKLEEAQRRGDLEVLDGPAVRREDRGAAGGTPLARGARGRTGGIPRERPALHPWASRDDILGLALMKETDACGFYMDLASKSRVRAARELFDALAREEGAHAEWLRAASGMGPEGGGAA